MYWCNSVNNKRILLIAGLGLLSIITACKREDATVSHNLAFFDIKGFFRADSAKLSKLNPLVTKTTIHNGTSETKKVHITDWGTELSLFTASDINKPAWKADYTIQNADGILIYKAKTPDLKTREIVIKKSGNAIKWILIFNHTKNMLYENIEKLTYYPDSLYQIQKKQHVRLIGTNTYSISGSFINASQK